MVEELPTSDGIGLIPEPAKVSFDAPRPAGSQLLFLQSIQFFLTFFIELLDIEEEVVANALETIISLLRQLAMFFTTHLGDAFVEMLRDVKAIEHNLGLRSMTGHAVFVRLPHVD